MDHVVKSSIAMRDFHCWQPERVGPHEYTVSAPPQRGDVRVTDGAALTAIILEVRAGHE